jgi:hypothetical protein
VTTITTTTTGLAEITTPSSLVITVAAIAASLTALEVARVRAVVGNVTGFAAIVAYYVAHVTSTTASTTPTTTPTATSTMAFRTLRRLPATVRRHVVSMGSASRVVLSQDIRRGCECLWVKL